MLEADGLLITPGLVDFHTHVYPYGSAIGIPPDELAPLTATTTAVSAGDAGANNVAALHRYVAAAARTRVHAFVTYRQLRACRLSSAGDVEYRSCSGRELRAGSRIEPRLLPRRQGARER